MKIGSSTTVVDFLLQQNAIGQERAGLRARHHAESERLRTEAIENNLNVLNQQAQTVNKILEIGVRSAEGRHIVDVYA
jgi:hypothetical protein